MHNIPLPSEIRQDMLDLVLKELLGPAGGDEEEIANESVQDRYIIGMLAPRKQQAGIEPTTHMIDPSTQDDATVGGQESAEDPKLDVGASQTPTMRPSSFGLTCCIAGDVSQLSIRASWARYHRVKSDTQKSSKTGESLNVWKRQPMSGTTTISLHEGDIAPWCPEPENQPDVVVQGIVRRNDDTWIVTLFLVNEQTEPKRNKDAYWIFQPELALYSPDDTAIFRRRQWKGESTVGASGRSPLHAQATTQNFLDEQQQESLPLNASAPLPLNAESSAEKMRYRNNIEFAVGHGVSVHAETATEKPTHATRITTRVAPIFELPSTTFTKPDDHATLAALTLDMKILAETPAEELENVLMPLVATYTNWIKTQRQRITTDESLAPYQNEATQTLNDCATACTRIQEGIQLIATNPQAAKAFAFMNRAMWQQRIHTKYAEQVRTGQIPGIALDNIALANLDQPSERSWRLFQLAFILINLPALTDLNHPDRSADETARADLLWFPTGGGKTEAYLGLTAYTLAIRRLQGEVAGRSGMDGVAVLMRYTLRLLTLQQFQRATTLICACEVIRRTDVATWGTTPFRIGLWVGQRTTPNNTDDSESIVNKKHGHATQSTTIGGSGTPHQLTFCPWCGQPIEIHHIKVNKDTRRTIIPCGDSQGTCPFSEKQSPEGLPVLVVDEDIYRHVPSLLIATVDKFAQLPWNGTTQILFGHVHKRCERHGYTSPDMKEPCGQGHRAIRAKGLPAAKVVPCKPLRPPDLIIQDELHLISGPLGTLVGLYETVIDRLATWEVQGQRIRPKVIASTATVRRASDQMHALFLRQLMIFPPPGLDASDNFFAVQQPPTPEKPGRAYFGICALGKRQKAVLIRVYVALLAAAQTLYKTYDIHADPWMTLVGYFNTIRELGGMRRLVEDDVRSRLRLIDRHGLATRTGQLRLEEITSRKGATDIPNILAHLEIPFDPVEEQKRKGAKKAEKAEKAEKAFGKPPLDVVLATNMISVGVDVRRLGLMVVSGQPKTTAEYIQATSRVGRAHPGLVCTIFNWARPRDLSHYEQFEHYHATFAQHVEALSVTPFSARALDRGLTALLVSFVRLLGSEFNADEQAGQLTTPHPYLDSALQDIASRAASVTRTPQIAAQIQAQLQQRIDSWIAETQRGTSGRILSYKRRGEIAVPLLKQPSEKDWDLFTCLNSLRDVEPTVALWMHTGPLESSPPPDYCITSVPQDDDDDDDDTDESDS